MIVWSHSSTNSLTMWPIWWSRRKEPIYIWSDGIKQHCSVPKSKHKTRKRRRKRRPSQSNCRGANWAHWAYTHCQRRHWSMPTCCHCTTFGWNIFSIICACTSQPLMTRTSCPTFMTAIMMHSARRWLSLSSMVQKLRWLRRAMHRWLVKRVL